MKATGMKVFSAFLALAFALAPAMVYAQARQQFGANNPLRNVPVTGTVTGTEGSGEAFVGNLDIERFEAVGDQLLAVGSLSGKIGKKPVNHAAVALPVTATTDTLGALQPKPGAVPASLDRSAGLLVVPAQATCPVLHLSIAPIDLNLLGLLVHTDTIVLNIDAQQGPSNLLGNLLCGLLGSLSGLLNIGAAITDIAAALNNVANVLNGVV